MKKPFDEIHGVEAEKAEAMRRYKNRRTFRNILRSLAVALLCCLWFPMVRIAGNWFYRTGSVMLTNRIFVFFLVNLLIVLIFVLSRDDERDCSGGSETEPDLYDRYTSSSAVIVTASSGEKVEDDDSKKQIVPVFIPEVEKVVVVEEEGNRELVVTTDSKGSFRRTKSEKRKKKEVFTPVKEYRRTESARMAMEKMSSEEFRLKVETFIMEKKRSLVQEKEKENDVVSSSSRPELLGSSGSGGGYGSC